MNDRKNIYRIFFLVIFVLLTIGSVATALRFPRLNSLFEKIQKYSNGEIGRPDLLETIHNWSDEEPIPICESDAQIGEECICGNSSYASGYCCWNNEWAANASFCIGHECTVNGDCASEEEMYCNGSDACFTSTYYSCLNGRCMASGGAKGCTPCQFGCTAGECIQGEYVGFVRIGSDDNNLQLNKPLSSVLASVGTLSILDDKLVSNKHGEFPYTQSIENPEARIVYHLDEQNEEATWYLRFEENEAVYSYNLSFLEPLVTDLDQAGRMEDLKKISMLGKNFDVMDSSWDSITLISGKIRADIAEGSVQSYKLDGRIYEIEMLHVGDNASFLVNGEPIYLEKNGIYRLADGIYVGLGDITDDRAIILLDSQKVRIIDYDYNEINSGYLEVNEERIPSVHADIVAYYQDERLAISAIGISWTAEKDYYVAMGGKLSEYLEGTNKSKLLLGKIDYYFRNLNIDEAEWVQLMKQDDRYDLRLPLAEGEISFSAFYESNGTINLGADENSRIVKGNTPVREHDYFIATRNKSSHLVEVKDVSERTGMTQVSLQPIGGASFRIENTTGATTDFYLGGHRYSFAANTGDKTITILDHGSESLYTKQGLKVAIDDMGGIGMITLEDPDAVNSTVIFNDGITLTEPTSYSEAFTLYPYFQGLAGYTERGTKVIYLNDELIVEHPYSETTADVYIMEQGASIQTDCQDTDGRNYSVRGSTFAKKFRDFTGEIQASEDIVEFEEWCCVHCLTAPSAEGPYLHERWCEDDIAEFEFYKCPYGCSDGACLPRPESYISVTGCRALNQTNTTYVLDADIFSSGDCIAIVADNIIFDGNGYVIQGNGSGSGVRTSFALDGFTIRNTEIYGYEEGISVHGYNYALEHNQVFDCNYGIKAWGRSAQIAGNTLMYNSLGISSNMDMGVVAGNNAESNENGIHVSGSSNQVIDNTIIGNAINGLILSGTMHEVFGNFICENEQMDYLCDNATGINFTSNACTGIEPCENEECSFSCISSPTVRIVQLNVSKKRALTNEAVNITAVVKNIGAAECYEYTYDLSYGDMTGLESYERSLQPGEEDNIASEKRYEVEGEYTVSLTTYCSGKIHDTSTANITVGKAEPSASISLATLRDIYNVGEHIQLTDPPEQAGNKLVQTKQDKIRKIIDGKAYVYSEYHSGAAEQGGYVIELSEKPLLAKINEQRKIIEDLRKISTSMANAKQAEMDGAVAEQKRKLEAQHSQVKQEIISRISPSGILSDDVFVDEYTISFNGLYLDIPDEEAAKLTDVDGVNAVYPNEWFNITLSQSVPMIGAQYFWSLDKHGNNCHQSGEECLTGEGISIGIIDTGIDYTHPDLGNCSIPLPEPSETCFEPTDLNISTCRDDDGGINYCHKGIVHFPDHSAWDYCVGNTLIERTCDSDGSLKEEEYVCPEQCAAGACVKYVDINELECDKMLGGYDFVNNDPNPMDDHGHGTHCAGIAAGSGILKGVAPDAKLYALKALSERGGYTDDILAAIEYAMDPNGDGSFEDHVDILSMSFGGRGDSRHPDDILSKAVDTIVDFGIVAAVSAGNIGPFPQTIGSPGTSRNAITVAASDKYDSLADFSSRGPVRWAIPNDKLISKPDIAAPGVEICAAQWDDAWDEHQCLDKEHTSISGTSMAAPHVAGAVALLKQARPELNPIEIKALLKYMAQDIGYQQHEQGAGRLNLSLAYLENPPLYVQLELDKTTVSSYEIIPTIIENDHESMQGYEISYREEGEAGWHYITSNGILGRNYSLDTAALAGGTYIIRLSATGSSGRIVYDEIPIEVKSFVIYDPYDHSNFASDPIVYRNGDIIEIKGEVARLDKNFRLSGPWLSCQSNWTLSGALTGNAEGVIALLYTNITDIESFCEMRIDYFNNDTLLESQSLNILLDPSLEPGWPRRFRTHWDEISTLPVIADLDRDGISEIVYATDKQANGDQAVLYMMDTDGVNKHAPLTLPVSHVGKISIADIDADGEDEIIFRGYRGGWHGPIFVVEPDNRIKQGWPKYYDYLDFDFDIAVYDINNDGSYEMATMDIGRDGCPVTLLDSNGNEMPGWPQAVDPSGGGGSTELSHVSFANMDEDSDKEIIFKQGVDMGYEKYIGIYVFDVDGTMLEGWPQYVESEDGMTHHVVNDIDTDGLPEIIFFATYYDGQFHNTVYIFGSDGKRLAQRSVDRSIGGLVVQDTDGDGLSEIITTDIYRSISVYDKDLNLLQTVASDPNYQPLTFHSGDDLHVAVQNEDNAAIYRFMERLQPVDRKPMQFWSRENPTLGNTEKGVVLVTTSDTPIPGELKDYAKQGKTSPRIDVYMWKLDGSIENEDWPTYNYDNMRSGCYMCEASFRPQSKIVNTGFVDVEGKLTMELQRYLDDGWITEEVVAEKNVSLAGGELLKLDHEWNPENISVSDVGRYRALAEFDFGKMISAAWEFLVVRAQPEISLAPGSIKAVHEPGAIGKESFTISNKGGADLEYATTVTYSKMPIVSNVVQLQSWDYSLSETDGTSSVAKTQTAGLLSAVRNKQYGNFREITVDGDIEDWEGIDPILNDLEGNIRSIRIANDEEKLYILAELADFSEEFFFLYLDTDMDPWTGCAVKGIGMEYGLTYMSNGESYMGDARDCAWSDEYYMNSSREGIYMETELYIMGIEEISLAGSGFNGIADYYISEDRWLKLDPRSGVIHPGAGHYIDVSINTTGLAGFNYADINIYSNDPEAGKTVIPVELEVLGAGKPDLDLYSIVFDPLVAQLNKSVTIKAEMTNIGDAQCNGISYSIDYGDSTGFEGTQPIVLGAEQEHILSFEHKYQGLGNHKVNITAQCTDEESSYDNNNLAKQIDVIKIYSESEIAATLEKYVSSDTAAIIVGDQAAPSAIIGAVYIADGFRQKNPELQVDVVLASQLTSIRTSNIISLGDPCVNNFSSIFLECNAIEPGTGHIQVFDVDDQSYVVVAAKEDEDIVKTSKVVANASQYSLSRNCAKVKGDFNAPIVTGCLPLDGYLMISTTKQDYYTNEDIQLTGPGEITRVAEQQPPSYAELEVEIVEDGMEVRVDGIPAPKGQYQLLPYESYTSEIGKPQMPVIRKLIAIPPYSEIKVDVEKTDSRTYDGYTIYPFQRPESDSAGSPPFTIDSDFYSMDAVYPESNVKTETGIMRDYSVALLEIYPIQYNPMKRQLMASNLKLRISYERNEIAQAGFNPEKENKMLFGNMYRLLDNYEDRPGSLTDYRVANSVFAAADQDGLRNSANRADYVIITDETLWNEAKRFGDYKIDNGLEVQVINATAIYSEFGSGDSGIKAFLEYAYNSWELSPTYLLLVGDADKIPVHYYPGTFSADIASDYYYSLLDGNDTFPEIFVGRFPASDPDELALMLNKTMQYEQNPPEGMWRKNALMVAHPQSAPGKYQQCKEEICNGIMPGFDYTAIKVYPFEGGTKQDVIDAINNGVSIVNYRGHGGVEVWGNPYIDNSDVDSLRNGDKLPVVFSIACWNSKIDHSTDCIGERWMKNGAVAHLGASRPSATTYNHDFDKYLFRAIFEDNIYGFAEIFARGNIGLINQHGEDNFFAMGNVKMYMLLGDPSAMVFEPERPEHDIAVRGLALDGTIKLNSTVTVNVTIMNNGLNNESDIWVNFSINGELRSAAYIPFLASKAFEDIFFEFYFDEEGSLLEIQLSTVEGEELTANNYRHMTVAGAPIYFTGDIRDYGIDEDGDGLYDYLALDLGVRCNSEGYFTVEGELHRESFIGNADFKDFFKPGLYNITLLFDGYDIYTTRKNGPYDIARMGIRDGSWYYHDLQAYAYETGPYNYTEFQNTEGPDLEVGYYTIEFEPGKPYSGQSVTIRARINNNGDEDSGRFNITIHHTDGPYWKERTYIGEVQIENMGPKAEYNLEAEWIADKSGSIQIEADAYDEVKETLEINNIASKPIEVIKLKPSVIRNTGTEPIEGDLVVQIQRRNGSWQPYHTVHESRVILTGDSSLALQESWGGLSIPDNGSYRAHASLNDDEGNAVGTASGWMNDSYTFDVNRALPDLKVDGLNCSPLVREVNEPVMVGARVTNSGPLEAYNITVRFMRYAQGGIETIGEEKIDLLSSGSSADIAVSWYPPEEVNEISVLVDPDNRIQETNEGNNQVWNTFEIKTNVSDLYASIYCPPNAVVNEINHIPVNIRNWGHRTATNNNVTVYLLENFSWAAFKYNRTNIFHTTQGEYTIKGAKTADRKLLLQVSYDQVTEELMLYEHEIRKLGNGVYIASEHILDDYFYIFISPAKEQFIEVEDIEGSSYIIFNYSFKPTAMDHYVIYVKAETLSEKNMESNFDKGWIKAIMYGPDLSVNMQISGTPIVNQELTIEGHIHNRGFLDALNVTVSLWEIRHNRTFVDAKKIEVLPQYESTMINLTFTPTEEKFYSLELVANVSNEGDPSNNRVTWHFQPSYAGADIALYLNHVDSLIAGQPTNLTFYVSNQGTTRAEDIDVVFYDIIKNRLSLNSGRARDIVLSGKNYSFLAYTDYGNMQLNLTVGYDGMLENFLLFDKQIVELRDGTAIVVDNIFYDTAMILAGATTKQAIFHGDLELWEERQADFTIVPLEPGEHVFGIAAYMDGDRDYRNNYDHDRTVRVIEDGPDLDVFAYKYTSRYIVNNTYDMGVRVRNIGSQPAYNSTVAMRIAQPFAETDEQALLPLINPGEEKMLNFSYYAGELGSIAFQFLVNNSDDVDSRNNLDFSYIDVLPDQPDLNVWLSGEQMVFLDENNSIEIGLQNSGGRAAYDTVFELILDGVIIYSDSIGFLDTYDYRNMEIALNLSEGEHILTAVAETAEDFNPEDNMRTMDMTAVHGKYTLFSIKDPEGHYAGRYFSYGSELQYIDGPTSVKVPGIRADANIRNEAEQYYTSYVYQQALFKNSTDVRTKDYFDIDSGNIHFAFISATEQNLDFSRMHFFFSLYDHSLYQGIERPALVCCEDWDFELEKCSTQWRYPDDYWFEYNEEAFFGQANLERCEAFGVAEGYEPPFEPLREVFGMAVNNFQGPVHAEIVDQSGNLIKELARIDENNEYHRYPDDNRPENTIQGTMRIYAQNMVDAGVQDVTIETEHGTITAYLPPEEGHYYITSEGSSYLAKAEGGFLPPSKAYAQEYLARAAPPACSEDDGGNDPYNAGTTSGENGEYKDYCHHSYGDTLTEYFCAGEKVESENVYCDNGCSAGACQEQEVFDIGLFFRNLFGFFR